MLPLVFVYSYCCWNPSKQTYKFINIYSTRSWSNYFIFRWYTNYRLWIINMAKSQQYQITGEVGTNELSASTGDGFAAKSASWATLAHSSCWWQSTRAGVVNLKIFFLGVSKWAIWERSNFGGERWVWTPGLQCGLLRPRLASGRRHLDTTHPKECAMPGPPQRHLCPT